MHPTALKFRADAASARDGMPPNRALRTARAASLGPTGPVAAREVATVGAQAVRKRFQTALIGAVLLGSAMPACGGVGTTVAPPVCPEPVTVPSAESAPAADAPATEPAPLGAAPLDVVLVRDGIPGIPRSLRDALAPYLDARGAFVERLSDDASTLLVSTRFGDTYQIHVVERPMGARTQVTFLREPVDAATLVPGTRDQVLYATDSGGDENTQLYRLDLTTGQTTLLTDGRSRHAAFVLSEDGRALAYNGNARNGRDLDLYLGDGRTQASGRLLVEREGQWTPLSFSPDGRRLLVSEYLSIHDSRLHVVDLESRSVTRVTPIEPVASYRAAVWARDGRSLYVASDRESDFIELFRLDLATGAFTPLSRELRWNVEEISLSRDGRTLAFTINEDGYSRLYLLDTRNGRARRMQPAGMPEGVISSLHFARGPGAAASTLAMTVTGPTAPADAWTVNVRTGRATQWTRTEVGGLDRSRFVAPELVRYRSFDGLEIPVFSYRPPGEGPFPVVIDIHGGPEAQSRPTFNAVRQYLLGRAGLAVLVPNVRGSDGYGKSYLRLDDAEKREDSVKDIGALLDWVASRPELDARRVAVIGGSYGGYMVLASLVHFGDRLRAGVDVVGIANFVTFLENTSAYRRDLRRAEYGDERDPAMRELLTRISPVTNAARIRSALFVAHGANDPRVPVGEAEQIVRAVRQNGQDVWYMLARNEGHGFDKKSNRDAYVEAMAAFLDRHLGARD
jgi:dipeptidyl aminopeptidase/acylaminoacyl peptidase